MKKLAFKDGYAIVVSRINEVASEYHVEKSSYTIEVVFRTAIAIKRFAAYVGEFVMDKDTKSNLLLRKKNYQQVSFYCTLPLEQIPTETHPLWYEKTGVGYTYSNIYTGEHFATKIPTTRDALASAKKNKDFADLYKNGMVGSCAGGESFKSLVDAFVKCRNVISMR